MAKELFKKAGAKRHEVEEWGSQKRREEKWRE